jgi:hypothetical protein
MIKLKPKQEIIELIKQVGMEWNVPESEREHREDMLEILGESSHPNILFKGTYEPGVYKHKLTGKEYRYSDNSSELDDQWDDTVYINSVDDLEYLRVQLIEQDNDGDGNECRKIYHIPQYDLYIRVVGTYSSWSTARWHGVEIVRPKQVTVTVYDSE